MICTPCSADREFAIAGAASLQTLTAASGPSVLNAVLSFCPKLFSSCPAMLRVLSTVALSRLLGVVSALALMGISKQFANRQTDTAIS